jgi:hypothetical protein
VTWVLSFIMSSYGVGLWLRLVVDVRRDQMLSASWLLRFTAAAFAVVHWGGWVPWRGPAGSMGIGFLPAVHSPRRVTSALPAM